MHPRIAERIVHSARLAPGATVLEIGPGTGILTRALLATVAKVIAVEADPALCEQLRETFAAEIARGQLVLIAGDIRAFDPNSIVGAYDLVANIPYYLTGDIIRAFLTARHQPRSMTLLVQKEVAERIARSPKESLASLSVKAYGTPHYEFTVPRGAFLPPPKVDSAVLSIAEISRGRFSSAEAEQTFFALIHAGFAHKRKRLAKNLGEKGFSALGVAENTRAEDLSLAEWLALSKFEGLAP